LDRMNVSLSFISYLFIYIRLHDRDLVSLVFLLAKSIPVHGYYVEERNYLPPINSGLYALTPPAFISSLNAIVAY
jgi:hypothetical protein